MNTKTKGIVAGVAGGALLLGAGGTFALWHDDAGVAGGIIRSGHLDVEAEDATWYDVSPDRPDAQDLSGEVGPGLTWDMGWLGQEQTLWNSVPTEFHRLDPDGAPGGESGAVTGHPIDLSQWQAVPGDFVLGRTRVHADVRGDNMEAKLSVHGAGRSGELADGLGVKYVVAHPDGTVIDQATDIGQAVGVPLVGDEVTELQVFVVASFPAGISQQDLQEVEANLADLHVLLEQVR
jgi:alternate signal-mediated exported protein